MGTSPTIENTLNMNNDSVSCNSCKQLQIANAKMKKAYEAILNSVAQKLPPEMSDIKTALLEKIKIMDEKYETH